MRFEQLHYLRAIVQHGSFRQAARELNLAQPSLTQAVRNLEDELHVLLLDRRPGHVELTDAGREMMPHLLGALECEARIRDTGNGYAQLEKGTLNIGTTLAGNSTALPKVLREFCARYPGVDVQVVEDGSGEITRQVRERKLDLGIVTRVPHVTSPLDGLEVRDLVATRLTACMRRDNPLANRRTPPTLADIAEQPLILAHPGYALSDVMSTLFPGRSLNVVFRTNTLESAKRMVSEGLGITVFTECSVGADRPTAGDPIYYRPIRDEHAKVRISAIHRREEQISNAADTFWAMLINGGPARTLAQSDATPVTAK